MDYESWTRRAYRLGTQEAVFALCWAYEGREMPVDVRRLVDALSALATEYEEGHPIRRPAEEE